MTKQFEIQIELTGTLPIMFDRYAGDNKTVLPVREKAALDDNDHIVLPALNIISMLSAENTQSVAKLFGKSAKAVARDIKAGFSVGLAEVPLLVKGKPVKMPANVPEDSKAPVYMRIDVARVKGGIPNPKKRPVVNAPWSLQFSASFLEGDECKLATLRDAFARAGRFIGLGTFRPQFGQFQLTQWDVTEI
ncbi:MAG: hypothetical protein ACREXP_00550 [Steroidobacteraceae bacterium]